MSPTPNSKKRLIDNAAIRDKVAKLHLLQLEVLMERLEERTVEPQEMRILLDLAKLHHIGIDTVEDLVKKALDKAEGRADDIEIDESWGFDPNDK